MRSILDAAGFPAAAGLVGTGLLLHLERRLPAQTVRPEARRAGLTTAA
ncbi:hypothetical protein ACFV0O_00180 [Kitasatospora sp. NPDC059577]